MGNWNYRSTELAKRLSKETIRKGGIEQINAPILNCRIASELEEATVQVGGYPTLVNYNKHKENNTKKIEKTTEMSSEILDLDLINNILH